MSRFCMNASRAVGSEKISLFTCLMSIVGNEGVALYVE